MGTFGVYVEVRISFSTTGFDDHGALNKVSLSGRGGLVDGRERIQSSELKEPDFRSEKQCIGAKIRDEMALRQQV